MSKTKGKTRLKNLVVNEVSLVDKGANGKHILLYKAADAVEIEMPKDTPAETPVEKAEDEAAAPETETPAAKPTVDLEKALADRVAEIEKAAAEKLEKALADAKAEHAVEMQKAADEKVALEKRLADEQEAKEVGEAIQKAATAFKNLPAKADALGPDLRKVRKACGDEVADRLESLLKSLDAAVTPALEPKGVAKAEEKSESAWAEIEKRAKSRVSKDVSFSQAVDAVLREDNQLYTAYEAEKTQR